MKKGILVLSALLTLVVSGICLQSCSSEYGEYTTEEYGYYTEEEIDNMMALAQKYDIDVKIDRNYYGKKTSLSEFEEELKGFVNLPGDYELVKDADSQKYYFKKKHSDIRRSKTRAGEASLADVGEISISSMDAPCTFYLSWRLATPRHNATARLSVSAPYYLYGNSDVIYNAVITHSYISISENVTLHKDGASYGRYNISGTYYAEGRKDFKIVKVPEE